MQEIAKDMKAITSLKFKENKGTIPLQDFLLILKKFDYRLDNLVKWLELSNSRSMLSTDI